MASIYRLHRDYSDIGHLSSKYGDVIAEKTGLGRTWVGVILMASVTSLPELVTGISSATIFNVPDIAAGDVLGSCMFNILILAIDDLFYTKGPTLSHVSANHLVSSSAAIAMTASQPSD